jgi:hypothetical protein
LADEDEWDWIMDEIHKARKADHRPRVPGARPRPPVSVRAQGRRLDADGAGAGGLTDTFWVYDGDQAILEFAGGAATAPSHRYLWGPAVDQILADEQVATGSPADVRWPMADWQGTVRGGLHERYDTCQSEGLSGVWRGLLGEARSRAREGPSKGGALIRRRPVCGWPLFCLVREAR